MHQYALLIDDPSHTHAIAQAVDREFANSSFETQTLNDKDYLTAQLRQVGNVRLFVNAILGAVLFTLLFLTGNTMMQSVRDRVPELGVLKSLGFTDAAVLWTVLVEALVLTVTAALVGLVIAAATFPSIFPSIGMPFTIPLPLSVWATGVGIAMLLATLIAVMRTREARRTALSACAKRVGKRELGAPRHAVHSVS